MPAMRRDVDETAWLHVNRLVIALEQKFGFALQDDNPFAFLLIAPKPIGTGVPGGDDPFDADVFLIGENFVQFLGKISRDVVEEGFHPDIVQRGRSLRQAPGQLRNRSCLIQSLPMNEESTYICDNCGEEIVVPVDPSARSSQEYVEDCPVCCNPNVIHVEIDEDGDVRVWGEAE